jgi:hypothetical protein
MFTKRNTLIAGILFMCCYLCLWGGAFTPAKDPQIIIL